MTIGEAIAFMASDKLTGHLSVDQAERLSHVVTSAYEEYRAEVERRRKAAPFTQEFWQNLSSSVVMLSSDEFTGMLSDDTARRLSDALSDAYREIASIGESKEE